MDLKFKASPYRIGGESSIGITIPRQYVKDGYIKVGTKYTFKVILEKKEENDANGEDQG